MRKLLYIVFMCFIPACIFAASTTVFTIEDQGDVKQIKAVTTHGDGSHAFTTQMIPYNLRGCKLHSIRYLFGTTAPTDNSDLVLNEHTSTGPDILGGAGADIIDNATNSYVAPLLGSSNTEAPIYGDLYPVLTNNVVDAATYTIYYNFIGCEHK